MNIAPLLLLLRNWTSTYFCGVEIIFLGKYNPCFWPRNDICGCPKPPGILMSCISGGFRTIKIHCTLGVRHLQRADDQSIAPDDLSIEDGGQNGSLWHITAGQCWICWMCCEDNPRNQVSGSSLKQNSSHTRNKLLQAIKRDIWNTLYD